MIRALRPGGWLVVTDADFRTMHVYEPDAAFDRVASAFTAAARAAGWDPTLGASLMARLEDFGLIDVRAELWQTYGRGSEHAHLFAATLLRLRDALIAHGAPGADIDDVAERLIGSSVGFYCPAVWTAWGRRPSDPVAPAL